jgi:hypothetical protein
VKLYTLNTFALALDRAALSLPRRIHAQLLEAVTLIQKEAKGYIGHSQDDWKPLASSTEAVKSIKDFPLGSPLLADGQMRSSITKRVMPWMGIVEAYNRALYFHEKGTAYMPRRPVLSRAVFKNEAKLMAIFGRAVFPLISIVHL